MRGNNLLVRWWLALLLGVLGPLAACSQTKDPSIPRYVLRADQTWQLTPPKGERFDASGLLLRAPGEMLTINDRGSTLYRIQFGRQTNAATLVPIPECFTEQQLQALVPKTVTRFDCEGIAQDEQGRLYICEESQRFIFRWDPKTKTSQRLPIDWQKVKKYFSDSDPNASWEGIAFGGGKLYVANERQIGRIIVIDPTTWTIEHDFSAQPNGTYARDVHYSDLCWFEGSLFALLRESFLVLQIDPKTRRVLAEFMYGEMELQPEVNYRRLFPTSTMEGLAVDQDHIWLVTDNNGYGRARYPQDTRPTLFRCPRPDRRPAVKPSQPPPAQR